jgi:hypothetical protein
LLGELTASTSSATPGQIRDLVDRNALPLQVLAALQAVTQLAEAPTSIEVENLLRQTAQALACCADVEEAMSRHHAEPVAASIGVTIAANSFSNCKSSR